MGRRKGVTWKERVGTETTEGPKAACRDRRCPFALHDRHFISHAWITHSNTHMERII